MEKLGRLVKILWFIRAQDSITAKELSEKFEVSIRTIYRDIEALNLWGVPIIAEAGHKGGYRLPTDYTIDPKMFTRGEANVLGVGSISIEGFTDFVEDTHELEVARTKLLAALPEKERRMVGRLIRYIFFDNSRWYKNYIFKDVLRILKQAVILNRCILLEYHEREDPSAEKKQISVVDPYGLVFKSDTWYLVGYSHSEQRLRRWNILRVIKAFLTDEEFIRDSNFILSDWWEKELEEFGKGNIRVLLRIDKKAWHRFSRFNWKKENKFFDMGDYIVVEMVVDKYEWLVDVVMVNRGDVEILEPLELREKIATSAEIIFCRHRSQPPPFQSGNQIIDFEVLGMNSDDVGHSISSEMERD